MAHRRKRNRIAASASRSRGRIRINPLHRKDIPPDCKPIFKIRGYNPNLPARKLRFCMDEDTGVLRGAFETNIAQTWVTECGLGGREDRDVVRWSRSHRQIIVTFNSADYWPERSGFRLNECHGILVLAMPNDGRTPSICARLIDNLVLQLGNKVPADWWERTKIKINPNRYVVKQCVNGQNQKLHIYEASNGALWFKTVQW